jgi:arylsulfatase A-like enzyme
MSLWFEAASWSLQLRPSLLFDALLNWPDQLVDYYDKIVPPNPTGLTYFPARSLNEQPDADPRAIFHSAERFIGACPTPFFLWIHTFPPHLPYIVDAAYYQRFLKTTEFTTRADFTQLPSYSNFPRSLQPTLDKVRLRYDEHVAEVDGELGSFLDWLSRRPIGSNIVLIVTADHGESFHHYFGHKSPDLHYSELHIPLLIALPGQRAGSLRSEDEDLTDVAPTVLELAGIKVPDWMEGHSLAPLSQTPPGEHASFAAWLLESSIFTRIPSTGSLAVNEGDYKLVWYFPGEGRRNLYNIKDDPDETRDISAVLPDKVADLSAKIRGRFGGQLR